ncbi:hypothetical protein C7A07_28420, partial [Pseudomonas fragi]
GQALNNLEPDGETPRPGPGLLQRLFGSKEVVNEAVENEPTPRPAPQPAVAKPADAEPQPPEQSEELMQALRAFAPQPQ